MNESEYVYYVAAHDLFYAALGAGTFAEG